MLAQHNYIPVKIQQFGFGPELDTKHNETSDTFMLIN